MKNKTVSRFDETFKEIRKYCKELETQTQELLTILKEKEKYEALSYKGLLEMVNLGTLRPNPQTLKEIKDRHFDSKKMFHQKRREIDDMIDENAQTKAFCEELIDNFTRSTRYAVLNWNELNDTAIDLHYEIVKNQEIINEEVDSLLHSKKIYKDILKSLKDYKEIYAEFDKDAENCEKYKTKSSNLDSFEK